MTVPLDEKPNRISRILLWVVVAIGIVIRISQIVRRPALWLDEAMLSLSIVNRSWRALIFSPLEFSQSAPPLYLQIAKISTLIFGPNELGLRFPSFVFSVASMILFAVLARRIFRNEAAVVATAFFALSPMLVVYSAEAKPYAGDALVTISLILLAIRLRDSRYEMKWLLVMAGAIAVSVFLADIGVLVVAGVGLGLTFLAWRERDMRAARIAKIIAPACLLLGAFAVWGIRRRIGGHTTVMLHSAWSGSFWPLLRLHSLRDLFWPLRVTTGMFPVIVGVRPLQGLTLLLAIIGAVTLWRGGKRDMAALVFGTYVVALGASAARVYPYSPNRVALYLAPILIIAITAGVEALAGLTPRLKTVVRVALFLVLLMPQMFVLQLSPPPWLKEDLPPVLAHIRQNRQPGDKIFTYWAALPATLFYGHRYGIRQSDLSMGQIHGKDSLAYAHDLAPLIGQRRVWVIFSHDENEWQRDRILAAMDSVGRKLEVFPAQPDRPDAVVFLYDLSGRAAP